MLGTFIIKILVLWLCLIIPCGERAGLPRVGIYANLMKVPGYYRFILDNIAGGGGWEDY